MPSFTGTNAGNLSGGSGASTLDELTDVTITDPSNGQALIYDAGTEQWVNSTDSGPVISVNGATGAVVLDLGDINNVTLTLPLSDGEVLAWDSATSQWVNTFNGSGTVSSVTADAPLTGGTITTTGNIGITQATGGTDGYLSSADWTTFNNKGSMSSFTVSDGVTSETVADGDTLTVTGGTGLTSTVSATDTVTLDLDDTAVTAGSYTYASITVDDQGRLTAASSGTSPSASAAGNDTEVQYNTGGNFDADANFTYDVTNELLEVTKVKAQNVVQVRNTSGVTLEAGRAVYVSGFDSGSGRPLVAYADASDPAKMPSVGIVTNQIGTGNNGFVALNGQINGVNTATFGVGDTLYVSTVGDGSLTNIKPTGAAELIQNVGRVLSSAASGKISVSNIGRTNDVPNTISADTAIFTNNVDIGGKLTVTGLIDPTGLELTPVAANPGGAAANTVWIDSADSAWKIGSNEVVDTGNVDTLVAAAGFYSAGDDISVGTITTSDATLADELVYVNGSGGLDPVTIGTGVAFSAGTLSATGAGGTVTSVGTTLSGLSVSNPTTTPSLTGTLGLSSGGTGGTTASAARSNLGLVIGTNVQAYDADLSTLADLSSADGNFIVGSATGWVAESGATARSSLGLGSAATAATGDFATAAQGALADSALQSGDNISELTNNSGFTTNTGTVTSVATGTGLTGGTDYRHRNRFTCQHGGYGR